MATAVGTRIPAFDLELSGGTRLTDIDVIGTRTVLYFYPKDDTSGCTVQAHDFTDALSRFAKAGVQVIGVSPDPVASHDRFAAKCSIGFPLLADVDRQLCEAFGVWVEKSMYGKKYMGVERSTFLVDADGRVEREWRKVKPAGHAAEVLEAL